MTTEPHESSYKNRLAREKSPYLLQHQHNPVDWFAWGDEAFEQARAGDKPIFLSIGYSTCHWCHVMERESFESRKVADFLNAHFISIKVDREERPDVDKIYMTFVQSLTGQGGWPLTAFLTPELKPFYGGTYFPPEGKFGRPGFLQLLQQVHELWLNRREEVLGSAADMHARLEAMAAQEANGQLLLSPEILRHAGRRVMEMHDPVNGGFGGAPKFPQPSHPSMLLRCARRFHDTEAARMVLHTCDRMAAGGIHDQLGGGFARYAVDARWLVPHFEKMLYDNAQLLDLYLDAHLVSGEPRHAAVARDIIAYVLRDMTDPGGGFYSAEDADSEGHEGKFYCWTREELSGLLTPEEFNVAVRRFGITAEGNFTDHSHPEPLPNQNVLSIADAAVPEADQALLESATGKMLTARDKRVRPHRDDKVLSSWNGLMLGALARAAVVLGDDAYRAAAERNLAFLRDKLWDAETRTLHHRWRDGERDSVQLLEAYAFLLDGVIDLYEATLEPGHLEFAIALAESMVEKFHDSESGGFYQGDDTPDLIMRVKDDYDGAVPSGNSVAALALLKLAAITGRPAFRQAAEKTLHLFAERLQSFPQAVPHMLHALDFWMDEPVRVVVAGDPRSEQTRALLRAVHGKYHPNKVVLGNTGPVEELAGSLKAPDGATAWLCTGTACQPPTQDPEAVGKMLE